MGLRITGIKFKIFVYFVFSGDTGGIDQEEVMIVFIDSVGWIPRSNGPVHRLQYFDLHRLMNYQVIQHLLHWVG